MGTWFPMGPDFVDTQRDNTPPARLSRRNEQARQTKVRRLTLDTSVTPPIIYTVDVPYPQEADDYELQKYNRPFWPAAGTAFRSIDDGRSWTSISDALTQQHPGLIPSYVAVHPAHPNVLYLGAGNGDVAVSSTSGDSWSPPVNLGAPVVMLVVDPNSSSPATTTIYAATTTGLQISTNGGGSWGPTQLTDNLTDLAFHLPAAGTPDLYAGAAGGKVYHATDPNGPWTLLSGTASGLPAVIGNYNPAMIEMAATDPTRVYVMVASGSGQCDLYTTGSAPSGFTKVPCPAPVTFDSYRGSLSLTPDSPGGATDVLFITEINLHRSTDGGKTWQTCVDSLHGDHNWIAYAAGAPHPVTYVGCDGGLFVSRGLADPAHDVTSYPADYDDQQVYDAASPVSQNYNHGKLSLAISAYGADPRYAAYGYATAQDTGHSSHTGTLGWRGLSNNGDGWAVAAHAGSTGMTSWWTSQASVNIITDRGEAAPTEKACYPAGNSAMSATSHLRVAADGRCLVGVSLVTTLQSAIVAAWPGATTATPVSMLGIVAGVQVMVNNSEVVTVESVTATTFSAKFYGNHAANEQVKVFSGNVVAVDETGAVTVLGPTLGPSVPKAIAPHPSDPNTAVVITAASATDPSAWIATNLNQGPAATWTEITGGAKPTGGLISTAAIDSSGAAFALLTDLTLTVPGGGNATTPLYEVTGGQWVAQPSVGLPPGQYGCMVAHPGTPGTLYIAAGADVFAVVKAGGSWTWTKIGPGLPGQAIVDLWIGNVGTAATPKILLRAAVVSRGVWEVDVTSGAATPDPPTRPYFRHQGLDQGWLSPSIEGQVDPFRPEAGASQYHWESPDIKIDAKRAAGYYQTDLEEPLPISHVAFNRLIDASESLPQSDDANVHVQVYNRSLSKLDSVSVWAIYCHFSGALPSLAASASQNNAFDFWGQFKANGSIVPSLPNDSPWMSVGAPQLVNGLDAAHPQVASFGGWKIPTLGAGDAGHYCMVVFAHSQANPIDKSSTNVDAIAVSNPQVGQRNLHVTAMMPMMMKMPGWYGLSSFVELHNPTDRERRTEILVDLRELPGDLHGFVHLTEGHHLASHLRVLRPDDDQVDPDLHPVADWLRDRSEEIRERHLDVDEARFRGTPRFSEQVALLEYSALHPIAEPTLQPHRSLGATIAFATRNEELLRESFRFQVVQRMGDEVVGGATYWIRPRHPVPLPHRRMPEFWEPNPIGTPWV